jgi:invasion protein IalB
MRIHRNRLRRHTGAGRHSPARPGTPWLHALAAVATLLSSAGPALAQTQIPVPTQFLAQAQTPAPAESEVERIQDWSLQCTKAQADKARKCFLIHNVFRAEDNKRILQIVVGRFSADNVLAALFFVPLGIRLPPGLILQIDKNDPLQIELELCTGKGCQAQVRLDDALLAAFKAGKGGEITFEDATGLAVGVAFSLKGFTAGMAKLP